MVEKGGRVKLDFYPFYSYEANLGFEFSEAHDGLKKSQATLYADYFKNIYWNDVKDALQKGSKPIILLNFEYLHLQLIQMLNVKLSGYFHQYWSAPRLAYSKGG